MHVTLVYFPALFCSALFAAKGTAAQVLYNGQIFTNGLAIVDSPAPETTLPTNISLEVAIDISGDGKIAQDGSDSTHFDSLEIYLVSYDTSTNYTVSGPDSGLLTQEPGSTVKHWHYAIDNCVSAGQYNLTFYETSHINGTQYYAITPIPCKVSNSHAADTCSSGSVNDLQSFPQASSPPAQNPWLEGSGTSVAFPSATGSSRNTVVVTAAHIFTAGLASLFLAVL